MNIILINPPYFGIDNDRMEQNLGLAYLAAALRQGGFPRTEILELTGRASMEACLALIPPAQMYGISCYTTSYQNVRRIIRHIRSELDKNAYIVLGGPHPTALPEETLRQSGADLVIVGEGERAIVQAARSLENSAPVRGVLRCPEIRNLDDIPFPVRLLGEETPFSRTFHGEPTLSLIATRGCPNRCVHCNSNIMGAGSHGVRCRSVENVIAEIRELKRVGVRNFRFNDDNFLAHRDILRLLKALAAEDIRFRVFAHVKYLRRDVCQLLAEAGCDFVSVGIESLNPDNLKFLKKTDNLTFLSQLRNAAEFRLTVRASFMVGLPYDTDESIEKYFLESAKLPIREYAVYPLIPYPGTLIAQRASEYHYTVLNRDYSSYMQMGKGRNAGYCLAYDNPETGISFGPEDVKRWKIRAETLLSQRLVHMSESDVAH